jgi:hypothetical protein
VSDREDAGGEVEVDPPQRQHLTAAGTGHQQHPDQQAPIGVVGPRGGDDPGRFLGGGRIGVRVGSRGFCAASIGLNAIQPHRTAAEYALLSTAWHCRMDDAASGRQTCGARRSSQS